ncbi:MAG: helix-turn-helix domain-containing protein, partial [bacterium]
QINVEVLPDEIRDSSEVSVTTSSWTQYGDTLPSALEQIEQIIIEEAISEADSKAEAARELGISRQALQYKLEQDQE